MHRGGFLARVVGICSLLVFYCKLFKRRFMSIIGGGKAQRGSPSILPVNQAHRTSSQDYNNHGATENWDDWTKDAKQELVSVTVVNQETVIEERKIENLFAGMAPVHQPKVVPLPNAQRKVELLKPEPQQNTSSRFALNENFAVKSAELDEWVDDNDNAWEQEDIDERDIAAVEKRKLALERKERRIHESKQRESHKETKKLGVRT